MNYSITKGAYPGLAGPSELKNTKRKFFKLVYATAHTICSLKMVNTIRFSLLAQKCSFAIAKSGN